MAFTFAPFLHGILRHFTLVSVQMLPAENSLSGHLLTKVPRLPIIFNVLFCLFSNPYPYLTAHRLYFWFWFIFVSHLRMRAGHSLFWTRCSAQTLAHGEPSSNVANDWLSEPRPMFFPPRHYPWLPNETWRRNGEMRTTVQVKGSPSSKKQVWGLEKENPRT